MKIRAVILLGLTSLLVSCAVGVLAPSEIRKKEYVVTTKAKKADAYSKALAHFAKTFGDANEAIKIKNEGAGQIVAKGNVPCRALPGDGISEYNLWFDLDFQAKDNKVRFVFEDLIIKFGYNGSPAPTMFNIQKKEDVGKLDKCLKPIVDATMEAINGSAKEW